MSSGSKNKKQSNKHKQSKQQKKGSKKKDERKLDVDDDKSDEKEDSNSRGIPKMAFVENPYKLVYNGSHERYLTEIDERLGKYRLMENQLLKQKMAKESQKKEMIKNLSACKYFQSKKDSNEEIRTNFNVSEQLFGTAIIDNPCDKVAIWLGAGVMLEFTVEDAIEFLNERISVMYCYVSMFYACIGISISICIFDFDCNLQFVICNL